MIAVVNYGLGNLQSIGNSLGHIGAEYIVTDDPLLIEQADKLILPGVGAFRDAIERLDNTKLGALVIDRAKVGVPLMGICLGMQILFERSYEYGEYKGLGLLEGEICPIANDLIEPLKVPHIGWNPLTVEKPGKLTRHLKDGDCVYFVHSYYAKGVGDALVASAEYGVVIPALVEKGNVCGAQFHPEKSGNVGLNMLKCFVEGEIK